MAQDDTPIPGERYGRLGRLRPPSAFHSDAVDPEWRKLFSAYVEQGMYRRGVLDQKTRELCAVAALAVLGQHGPLGRHILSAIDYGASREQVMEVLLQMSVYGGFPVTQAALVTYQQTLAEVDQALAETSKARPRKAPATRRGRQPARAAAPPARGSRARR
jgi:4-carboxymuconolactone decarboxylase